MISEKAGSREKEDGRSHRRTRNREKVLRSFLELVDEKTGLPTTEEVAGRAGVSRRSIFRYFTDLDDMIVKAYNYQIDELQDKFPPPAPAKTEGEVPDKIEEYVDHLSSIYEYTSSIREVLSEKGIPSDIRSRINAMRSETLRNRLQEYFGAFIDQDGVSEDDGEFKSGAESLLYALESSLSPESWDYLRGPCGLSRERAREAWIEMLNRLFIRQTS